MAQREDVWFASGQDRISAWLYQPSNDSANRAAPLVVMEHGLGVVRTMRLDAYVERFGAAGYACLVFDYRNFGDSEGQPRQLLLHRHATCGLGGRHGLCTHLGRHRP